MAHQHGIAVGSPLCYARAISKGRGENRDADAELGDVYGPSASSSSSRPQLSLTRSSPDVGVAELAQRREAASLRSRVELSHADAASQRAQVAAARADAAQLRSEVQAAEALASSRKSQLAAAEVEAEKLRAWASAAEKEASAHRSSASTAEAGSAQFHSQMEAARDEIVQLQAQLDAAEDEAAARQPRLESAEREVARLSSRVETSEGEGSKLRAKLQVLDSELAELRSHVEVAKAEAALQRSRAIAAQEEASSSSWAKATRAMEDAVSRTKAGCDQQVHACELRSRELQEQLAQRLQNSESRCRELEAELARVRSVAAMEAESASAEIQQLQALLSKQQTDLQSQLVQQQSDLESRLEKRQSDFQKSNLDGEQLLQASNVACRSLRSQLAQEQAVAAADATHASAQIAALKAQLADQKRSTQEALAKVAMAREHSEASVSEHQEKLLQERASIAKVVENVSAWIKHLEDHVAEQEQSMLDVLSSKLPQRDPSEASRMLANMSTEYTGLPPELSMLSDIGGAGDHEADQHLQILYGDLQAGLVKQRQAVCNAMSHAAGDHERQMEVTAARQRELCAQAELIQQRDLLSVSTRREVQLQAKLTAHERRMERLAAAVRDQHKNLEESMASREQARAEMRVADPVKRKQVFQAQVARDINALHVAKLRPDEHGSHALQGKFKKLQSDLSPKSVGSKVPSRDAVQSAPQLQALQKKHEVLQAQLHTHLKEQISLHEQRLQDAKMKLAALQAHIAQLKQPATASAAAVASLAARTSGLNEQLSLGLQVLQDEATKQALADQGRQDQHRRLLGLYRDLQRDVAKSAQSQLAERSLKRDLSQPPVSDRLAEQGLRALEAQHEAVRCQLEEQVQAMLEVHEKASQDAKLKVVSCQDLLMAKSKPTLNLSSDEHARKVALEEHVARELNSLSTIGGDFLAGSYRDLHADLKGIQHDHALRRIQLKHNEIQDQAEAELKAQLQANEQAAQAALAEVQLRKLALEQAVAARARASPGGKAALKASISMQLEALTLSPKAKDESHASLESSFRDIQVALDAGCLEGADEFLVPSPPVAGSARDMSFSASRGDTSRDLSQNGLNSSARDLSQLEAKHREMQGQLETKLIDQLTAQEKISRDLASKVAANTKQLDQMRAARRALADGQSPTELKEKLNLDLQAAEAALRSAAAESEKSSHAARKARLEELRKELASHPALAAANDDDDDELLQMIQDHHRMQEEMHGELTSELQSNEKALQDAAAERQALHEELKAAKSVQDSQDQKFSGLPSRLSALEEQLASELRALQATAECARTRDEQHMQAMYSELHKELGKQRESMSETMCQASCQQEERLRVIDSACRELQSRADMMQKGAAEFSPKNVAAAQRILADTVQGQHAEHLEATMASVESIKARLDNFGTQLSSTMNTMQENLRQKHIELEQLQAHKGQIRQLEDEVAKGREAAARSKDLEIQLQKYQRDSEQLSEQSRKEQGAIAARDRELQATQAESKELQVQLAGLRSKVSEKTKDADTRISQLEEQHTRDKEAILNESSRTKAQNEEFMKASEAKNKELQLQVSQQQETTKKAVENVASWISKLEVHLARSEKLMLDSTANAESDGQKHRKATEDWNKELEEQLAQQPEATAAEVECVTAKIAAFGVKMANQLKTMQDALTQTRDEGKQRSQDSSNIQKKLTQQRDATASEAKQASKRIERLEDLLAKQQEAASDNVANSRKQISSAQAAAEEQIQSKDATNQELQSQLLRTREAAASEVQEARARISELEVLMLKQRGEAEHVVAKMRLTGDDKLRSNERQIQTLQSELDRMQDAGAAATNDAAERMAALRVQLGRQQGDMEHAMAKAETVSDLLHASDTRNRVLQAQLTDQQQVAAAENRRAASRISELEAQILEQECLAREARSASRREGQERLDTAEAKRTELQAQLADEEARHAAEAESSTRRSTMLEAQLAELQKALQEALERSDERLQASETRARDLLEQSGKKQQSLQLTASREAAAFEQQLQSSHAAKQALEVQLAELRSSAASEAHCLQDALEEAKQSVSRACELEAKIEVLQEAKADAAQKLLEAQTSMQDVEVQLAAQCNTTASEMHQQRLEAEQLQAAKRNLEASLKVEAAEMQRQLAEAVELKSDKQELQAQLATQRRVEATELRRHSFEFEATKQDFEAQIVKLRRAEQAEVQRQKGEAEAELEDAKRDFEASLASQHRAESAQAQRFRSEADELETARQDLEGRLAAQRRTASGLAEKQKEEFEELQVAKRDLEEKVVSQRKAEAAEAQGHRREASELEAAMRELEGQLSAQRKADSAQIQARKKEADELEAIKCELEADLAAQHRLSATEALAARDALEKSGFELAEFQNADEANLARIRKLEEKLARLRSATDMCVHGAKRVVQEMDEEFLYSTRSDAVPFLNLRR